VRIWIGPWSWQVGPYGGFLRFVAEKGFFTMPEGLKVAVSDFAGSPKVVRIGLESGVHD